MDPNLSLYHIFYTAARTKNISKAAKELYISQPAVSKSISHLEEILNTALFVRSSRGVTLTAEGALLYEHASSAFSSLEAGTTKLKRIQDLGIGSLRIGVSTTLCKYLLLPYLKEFIEKNPHIKVQIVCQSTIHTVKLLDEGIIDVGLIGRPKRNKTLVFHKVTGIEDTFVATRAYLNNLALREQSVGNDIFKYANIMLLDEKNITRLYIEEYLREQKIELNQILEVSNMDLLIEFAKIGIGAACVIKEFVAEELKEGLLEEIPLSVPIPKRSVGFAYSQSIYMTEALKRFVAFYSEKEALTSSQ